jgi:hypothetical protein
MNKFTDKKNTKVRTIRATESGHSSATTQRRKAIITRYCLSSAGPARRKAIKTKNCLSSAELAHQRARPTETAKRLSTVLSLAPLGLSLARQNKHAPKKNKNCHDSCLSSFSALSKRGGQNNFTPRIFTIKNVENKCTRTTKSINTRSNNKSTGKRCQNNKRIDKHRRKSRKVRPIENLCQIIIHRQLIIPASVGTQTRTRLKKISKPKISRPKSPGGRIPPQDTFRRIITKNQIQGKVTPFPITNHITKAIRNSILLGLKMPKKPKKRDKKPLSEDTDSSQIGPRPKN